MVLRDEVDHPDCIGPELTELVKPFGTRLYDEKAAEDTHGFIRGLSRAKRNKHCGPGAALGAARQSGVMEACGLRCPEIKVNDVIT